MISEPELLEELRLLSEKNTDLDHCACFLGAGAYNHFIPSAVKHIVQRSEFYTAYTPYQAEASQGTLQAIYEYQSLICELTGMDVANASLYDGATAMVEGALLACRVTGRKEIVVSTAVNPQYRAVLKTYAKGADLLVKEIPYTQDLSASDKTAGVIIQQPNFFGGLEEVDKLADLAHKNGSLFIVSADPISLGILKRPADYGADVVTGEGQSLGNSLSFGGPYLGIFAAKNEYLRQLPGRIVGKTTDHEGRPGYVLTFQTREQHIRRERATSNICSNEALCALSATVYLSLMGKTGLKKVAELCLQKANYAKEKIRALPSFSLLFPATPCFKEFVVKCPVPVKELNAKLLEHKIIGGLDLERFYPELKNHMLLCVTELTKKEDIDRLVEVLGSFK